MKDVNYNIFVLKWGNKFTPEHVNRLYRMAKRNLTLPFNFYCHTEDPTNICEEVNIVPLDESLDLKKWWWKLTLFKENSLNGINLYLDLDVIIQKNIDHLFNKAKNNKIVLISNDVEWSEGLLDDADPITIPEYNSSVMIWYNNQNSEIYHKFIGNFQLYQKIYLGIDRFFTYEIDQNKFIDIGEEEWYGRNKLLLTQKIENFENKTITFPKVDENGRRVGTQSYRVFHDPTRPICIFNGCHEDYFYQGMEKYLI